MVAAICWLTNANKVLPLVLLPLAHEVAATSLCFEGDANLKKPCLTNCNTRLDPTPARLFGCCNLSFSDKRRQVTTTEPSAPRLHGVVSIHVAATSSFSSHPQHRML